MRPSPELGEGRGLPGGEAPQRPSAPRAGLLGRFRRAGAATGGSAPQRPGLTFAGTALSLLATLALGFAGNLLLVSHLQHVRAQNQQYAEFRSQLALGTAPVGPFDLEGRAVPLGAPVAILDIPRIGMEHEVVGWGTTSEVLEKGPGLLRSTVLPGQNSISVIYGRKSTYGGPFEDIDQLERGDIIRVTTAQGGQAHTYEVIGSPRREGSPMEARAPGQGRITLVTADGPWYAPEGVVYVDADLTSAPQVAPARPPFTSATLPENERAMVGDDSVWIRILLWGELLLPASLAFVWARARWGKWQAWLVGVPVLGALGLTVAGLVARLLPNLI
nr:class E sortase [Motilibacter aurantiacus]